jgi:hypothetical protein
MSTNVYIHPTLPAVIRSFESSFSISQQSEPTSLEDIAILDVQPQKVYYVTDIRNLPISFEDMLKGANIIARTEIGQRKYRHPNVIENLMVVNQRMVEVAAQNLKAPSLGSVQLKTFHSLEEALAYIEEQQVSS